MEVTLSQLYTMIVENNDRRPRWRFKNRTPPTVQRLRSLRRQENMKKAEEARKNKRKKSAAVAMRDRIGVMMWTTATYLFIRLA